MVSIFQNKTFVETIFHWNYGWDGSCTAWIYFDCSILNLKLVTASGDVGGESQPCGEIAAD